MCAMNEYIGFNLIIKINDFIYLITILYINRIIEQYMRWTARSRGILIDSQFNEKLKKNKFWRGRRGVRGRGFGLLGVFWTVFYVAFRYFSMWIYIFVKFHYFGFQWLPLPIKKDPRAWTHVARDLGKGVGAVCLYGHDIKTYKEILLKKIFLVIKIFALTFKIRQM